MRHLWVGGDLAVRHPHRGGAPACDICGSAVISLYDTLTGVVRPLRLREPGRVGLYACGPTVYDHPHLGHARSALTYDVLRRYLQWRGFEVHHVANVTDIDDKIIDRARREGRSEQDVAAEWEAVYVEAMAALGMLAPHQRPRATEWVNEMVALVKVIMAAGHAYTTSTGVYLRVRDVPTYGHLVHRSLDELRGSAGARVEVDASKEDPLDFALWKAAKPHEPSWPSPWGPGRPGWHIECAAMSLGLLGDGFDIHGGGVDLVFPHHTNERAEALAAGHRFARHWMHNAMLNVDGQKMAKSEGNYLTVAEMLDDHPLNGRAFRLLVLQTQYRKTMEVNADLLASARAAVGRLDTLVRRTAGLGLDVSAGVGSGAASLESVGPLGVGSGGAGVGPAEIGSSQSAGSLDEDRIGEDGGHEVGVGSARAAGSAGSAGRFDESAVEAFRAAMDDDLGTPQAVAVIFDTLRRANTALDDGSPEASALAATVVDLSGALGLIVVTVDQPGNDQTAVNGTGGEERSQLNKINEIVARRQEARKAKDWATADTLREQLSALDVIVEDTPTGPVWHRR